MNPEVEKIPNSGHIWKPGIEIPDQEYLTKLLAFMCQALRSPAREYLTKWHLCARHWDPRSGIFDKLEFMCPAFRSPACFWQTDIYVPGIVIPPLAVVWCVSIQVFKTFLMEYLTNWHLYGIYVPGIQIPAQEYLTNWHLCARNSDPPFENIWQTGASVPGIQIPRSRISDKLASMCQAFRSPLGREYLTNWHLCARHSDPLLENIWQTGVYVPGIQIPARSGISDKLASMCQAFRSPAREYLTNWHLCARHWDPRSGISDKLASMCQAFRSPLGNICQTGIYVQGILIPCLLWFEMFQFKFSKPYSFLQLYIKFMEPHRSLTLPKICVGTIGIFLWKLWRSNVVCSN